MNPEEYLALLYEECRGLTSELKLNKTHALHFALSTRLLTILEMSHAILVLLNAKCVNGVPPVLRTMLETYVDVQNLCSDPTYGYRLEATDLSHRLEMLKDIRDGANPYLATIRDEPYFEDLSTATEERKRELQKRGYKRLRVKERFRQAGMIDAYNSIYNDLSAHAHSSPSAQIDRHLMITSDGFEVTLYKPADTAHLIALAACILLNGTKAVLLAIDPRTTDVSVLDAHAARLTLFQKDLLDGGSAGEATMEPVPG